MIWFYGYFDVAPSNAKTASGDKLNVQDALLKYQSWLWKQYIQFLKKAQSFLSNADAKLQVEALRTLMEFVKIENIIMAQESALFTNEVYRHVVQSLVSHLDIKSALDAFLYLINLGRY